MTISACKYMHSSGEKLPCGKSNLETCRLLTDGLLQLVFHLFFGFELGYNKDTGDSDAVHIYVQLEELLRRVYCKQGWQIVQNPSGNQQLVPKKRTLSGVIFYLA